MDASREANTDGHAVNESGSSRGDERRAFSSSFSFSSTTDDNGFSSMDEDYDYQDKGHAAEDGDA